jgi:spoIIIJ-associated protein
MEFVEFEGDTTDEAIAGALKTLGVGRDRVTVEVLSEGKRGIFGFGAQKARVRVAVRTAAAGGASRAGESTKEIKVLSPEERAAAAARGREILTEILRLMGLDGTVEIKPGESEEEIFLNISCRDSALLIGRRGQTLEAIQYIITRSVSDKLGVRDSLHLIVDTEDYHERRRKSLEDMALRLGEKAKRQRKTVAVDALSAADRRVIHAALQDDPWVTTRSVGQGAYRRLLIVPEGDRKTKAQEKAPVPRRTGSREAQ